MAASDPDAMAANYKGKTINLLIGTTPGSGADLQARIIARHLGPYIPGSPRVVPQNMPGSGSVVMMNYLYSVSNRDGTAMGITVGGIYMRHIMGGQGVRHNLSEMIPIYNPEGGGAVIFASSKTGIKRPVDIVKVNRILYFGFQNAEGNSAMLGQAGFRMLGVKYKGIPGYKGSHDVSLATERGELDLGWNTPGAYKMLIKPKVDAGLVVPIFQTGIWNPSDNRIYPDPDLPDVPTFDALYREINGTDPSGALWDAWFAPLISYGRFTIFLPPKVPQIAIDALNVAFEATCKDEKFIEELDRSELSSKCYLKDEARAISERSAYAPPEAVKVLEELLKN
jgi:tripartite-type tricarboxylate transporter receptor subunit TctC